MTGGSERVVLVNPRITARRHARFPLSIMSLAAALEDRWSATLVDGNLDADAVRTARAAVRDPSVRAVGVTVMGGPQVATAIEISRAVRAARPSMPIVWGGYFPTLYADAALNCDYVDFAVRGQGEATFRELLEALGAPDAADFGAIAGLSWRTADGIVRHNPDRAFSTRHVAPPLRYDVLPSSAEAYLARTFLGERTAAHQGALGCRFRCTFCGVAALFRGRTALPPAERLDRDLTTLRGLGADSVQFYDHNFFDREADMLPLLHVLARHELPWWCYARSDALVNLSDEAWRLVRRSRLRMAYIGAETPNDSLLRSIRKGTRADQTLAAVEVCRRNGVIPELSFMVAPPEDPEEETERTFAFIREVKRANPAAEIIVYIHTPLPPSAVPNADRLRLPALVDTNGEPVVFPTTPEQWAEPKWVDYACHADAPWLTPELRRRIRDFVTVLRCRFPTVQDVRSSPWAKTALSTLARWRYALRRYDNPWELEATQRVVRLLDPRVTSL